jgi:hypothetical protein
MQYEWRYLRFKSPTKPLNKKKKVAGTGGLSVFSDGVAYSAACLRGGSSAPESWISFT